MTDKAPELKPCPVALAITEHWGERCPDFEQGCPCCDAWAEYDRLTADLHVKVKPLVWDKHPDEQEWYARLPEVEGDTFERGFMILPLQSHFALYDGFGSQKRALGHFTLVCDAKDAAQSLHSVRTHAALEPAPITPSQEAWQPIETAPKDGATIWAYIPATGFKRGRSRVFYEDRQMPLVWVDGAKARAKFDAGIHKPSDHAMVLVEKFGGYWGVGRGHRPIAGMPTHWMPLPKPPKGDV